MAKFWKNNQAIGRVTFEEVHFFEIDSFGETRTYVDSFQSGLKELLGSGCGAVGRMVAFDIKGPQFESSHRQNLYLLHQLYWKDGNKEKRPGMAHFLKKQSFREIEFLEK